MSVRTTEERQLARKLVDDAVHNSREFFDSLNASEKEAALTILQEIQENNGSSLTHDFLWELHYKEKPVPIWEFIDDKFYAGWIAPDLYPKWRDVIEEVLAPGSRYYELVLTGSIGSGKCVEKNTLIPTRDGIRTIEDIVRSKEKRQVYSESGLRDVVSVHDEGVTETRRVITKHGHILEGRPNHRVRVLNNLEIQWKCLDELEEGDCLIEQPLKNFSGADLPDAVAEVTGWYTADGCPKGTQHMLSLHPSEVDYVFELAEKAAIYWGATVRKYRNTVIINKGCLKTNHFKLDLSHDKEIPEFILKSSRKSIALFFKGLFSGDGRATETAIAFCTVSEKLARQSQILLTLMGYYCSLTSKKCGYKKSGKKVITGTAYTVTIIGDASKRKFIEEIGFWHGYKQKNASEQTRPNMNSDHSFSFRLSMGDFERFRRTQPSFDKTTIPNGLTKKTTPRGLIWRLKKQNCTVALLNKIKESGGLLPDILDRIASGELLFDTVKKVEKSKARCYDLTVDGDPSYNSNGFISHNSFCAALIYMYLIYKMSCLKNPAKYYSLIEGSKIIFGVYSVTKTQVKDVGYGIIRTYLEKTPYFQTRFPFDRRILKKIVFKEGDIEVVSGSQEFHVLGMNVFAMYLDEVNFMEDRVSKPNKGVDIRNEQGQAHEVYNAARSRIKSRFMRPGGSVPGMTVMISSKTHETSFLENHIKKHKDEIDAKKVFVADFARWEVQPQSRFILPKFKVQIGNAVHPSKVLDDDEIPESGTEIIEVPGEFREEFEASPDRALREIAGRSTTGVSPLFRDKKPILECIDKSRKHPFTKEILSISHLSDIEITDYLVNDEIFSIVDGEYIPKIKAKTTRVVHLDLALNKDRAGIAMGHISGMRKVKKMRTDRTFYFDYEPEIVVDLVLAVQLLNRGQIDYGKIRAFIFSLAGYGFNISTVTADKYQSADTLQIFEKAGWETGIQSVDTTPEPYLYLKQAIIDKRISFYNYPLLIQELSKLELDLDTNRIDHPLGGSKDSADAVAGMVFTLMKLKDAMPRNQVLHAATMNYEVEEALPAKKLKVDSGEVTVQGKMQVNMDVLADEVLKYLKNKPQEEQDG